jgi:hypothetical protein
MQCLVSLVSYAVTVYYSSKWKFYMIKIFYKGEVSPEEGISLLPKRSVLC